VTHEGQAKAASSSSVSVVILGDLHGHWDREDEAYYAALPCDLLLWTGDLADKPARQLAVAESLARCGRKALGLLGNHDGASRLLAVCEGHGNHVLEWFLSFGHAHRVRQLHWALSDHDVGLARRELPQLGLTLIGMCPLQSGGTRVSFRDALRRVYGGDDPEPLLRRHVEESASKRLLLLGHNGPAGLGAEPFAPFGRDWRAEGGDHGDPVFSRILEHAAALGKEVVLAAAGHMHDRLSHRAGRRDRDAVRCFAGIPVLNACRVPRLEPCHGTIWRWDYRVEIGSATGLCKVERVAWVAGKGVVSREEVYAPADSTSVPGQQAAPARSTGKRG
jgi:uncharacterized protein (TIGR04168 family)